MVFEYGMSDVVSSRTMRADNYALSEETKRLRDQEQARLTDDAFNEALRLLERHRVALDRIAQALLDKETLSADELKSMLSDVEPESRSSETVGTVKVVSERGSLEQLALSRREKRGSQGRREHSYPEDTGTTEDAVS